MARQTIVSTQQAERITDRALRHIRPIFGKCYGYPVTGAHDVSAVALSREHVGVEIYGNRFTLDVDTANALVDALQEALRRAPHLEF